MFTKQWYPPYHPVSKLWLLPSWLVATSHCNAMCSMLTGDIIWYASAGSSFCCPCWVRQNLHKTVNPIVMHYFCTVSIVIFALWWDSSLDFDDSSKTFVVTCTLNVSIATKQTRTILTIFNTIPIKCNWSVSLVKNCLWRRIIEIVEFLVCKILPWIWTKYIICWIRLLVSLLCFCALSPITGTAIEGVLSCQPVPHQGSSPYGPSIKIRWNPKKVLVTTLGFMQAGDKGGKKLVDS